MILYNYVIELYKLRNNVILYTRFTESERILNSKRSDKQINSSTIKPEHVLLNKFCLYSPIIFTLLEIVST